MGTVIHSVVDKAKLVSCRASPCEAGAAMCKSEPKPKPRTVFELDNNVVIAVVASVAVVLLLLLVLLVICLVKYKKGRDFRIKPKIDINDTYGTYDITGEMSDYTTVEDNNDYYGQ